MLKLSLGDWDLETSNDGVNIEAKVKKVIPHPEFNYFELQNDIALLELTEEVKFNDRIQPICIPPEGKFSSVVQRGRIKFVQRVLGSFAQYGSFYF